ncbi:uncharacterized protein LOC134752995 [Cydia strobilella]|uniref:uncharacterized protein LOC134752995 n=1 Tax=Cydia strobilella TaxID=1100964 RepID=UPI0030076D1C
MTTRPYQGYPYANPQVIDAPSIDAATASRWNNLPRRPLHPPQPKNVDFPDCSQKVSGKKHPDAEPDPVIYIDVPESSGSDVASPASSRNRKSESHSEPDPVIYIDVPESSGSYVAGPASSRNRKSESDSEPDPVIYIDVPDGEGSDVAGPARLEPEPEYVQETIFYDPFENRRIDRQKPSDTDTASGAGPSRPTPPNTLDVRGLSDSSGYGGSTKEASIYGCDDFSLSPLPVGQYPDLPPAYSEIDTPHTTHTPQTPPESTPTPPEPPRTVVITQGNYNRPPVESSIGLPSPDRKVVYCQHCSQRVHTLVIREIGPITHWIACFLFIFLMPFVVFVYCTNWFTYKNHYCPNCNKKIGYEMPAMCIRMTYIRTDTG